MPVAAGKPLDPRTRLAFERTRVAHERTLMAWVRTAALLVTVGFTLYKFFEFESAKAPPAAGLRLSPRLFAMAMISTGLLALFFGAREYRGRVRQLKTDYPVPHRSTALLVAIVVFGLGAVALLAALLRI